MYAIPSIISLIINSLYNMVDQIFIGQGVGFLGNGATNIIAPISTIAIAIAALFGDGLAAFFSLNLGQGNADKAAKGVGTAVIISSVVSIIFAAFAFIFLSPLCRIFQDRGSGLRQDRREEVCREKERINVEDVKAAIRVFNLPHGRQEVHGKEFSGRRLEDRMGKMRWKGDPL